MTALARRLGAVALATVAVLLLGTTPAHAATVLSTGRIDAFDIDYAGGVALYTTSLGSASFKFNTNTVTGCQITTWPGGGI